MGLLIRAAEPADGPRLREVAFAAKARWGYETELVRGWADGLDLEGAEERWVAEEGGAVVAWASLVPPADGVCVLDDLWVDPAASGRGIGSRLFALAAARAGELGARRLEWDSDPNATGFYEKLGARRLGERVGEWGRPLPTMGIEL